MKNSTNLPRRASVAIASAATFALLVATASSAQAATVVDLRTADSFVVLAGQGVTNTGLTTLSGDLGTSPNPAVVDNGTIVFASGVNYGDGGPTADAKLDLETAFGEASQDLDVTVSADLGGQELTPGVYFQASTMNLSAPEPLVLDAEGNPDAVWIFRAGSDLIVGPGAQVVLENGADVCNVFWQVGSSATLDAGADFMGTIIARTSIFLEAGAAVEGRVLALDGEVTMISNEITRPICAAPPTPGDDDQVTDVPTGSVATGDGSTSAGFGDGYLIAGGILIIATGAIVFTAGRLRGRNA